MESHTTAAHDKFPCSITSASIGSLSGYLLQSILRKSYGKVYSLQKLYIFFVYTIPLSQ